MPEGGETQCYLNITLFRNFKRLQILIPYIYINPNYHTRRNIENNLINFSGEGGTTYPSGAPEFTPVFCEVRVTRFVYVLYIVVCSCVLFLLAIVLSVLLLRITDSDNPFGIFKLVLQHLCRSIDCYDWQAVCWFKDNKFLTQSMLYRHPFVLV